MLEVVREEAVAQFPKERLAFKHRDRATIIADIIGSLVRKPSGVRKSNIKQTANLSTYMLSKYLDLLLLNALVKVDDKGIYRTTTKGLKLLQDLNIEYLRMTIRACSC